MHLVFSDLVPVAVVGAFFSLNCDQILGTLVYGVCGGGFRASASLTRMRCHSVKDEAVPLSSNICQSNTSRYSNLMKPKFRQTCERWNTKPEQR